MFYIALIRYTIPNYVGSMHMEGTQILSESKKKH